MKITMVIVNSGDGSNHIQIVKDPAVLARMNELADEGDEGYASGDGLQTKTLEFPDDFPVDEWVQKHFYGYTTMEDVG